MRWFCFSLIRSHYLGIAENGYQYDENVAFFPLLPWILRFFLLFRVGSITSRNRMRGESVGLFILIVQGFLSLYHSLLPSRTVTFFFSSLVFYSLSARVLPSPRWVDQSVLLFIYNPAAAHFTAIYTESVYTLLCFLVQWLYLRSVSSHRRVSLLFLHRLLFTLDPSPSSSPPCVSCVPTASSFLSSFPFHSSSRPIASGWM